jgi:hypothetical protein
MYYEQGEKNFCGTQPTRGRWAAPSGRAPWRRIFAAVHLIGYMDDGMVVSGGEGFLGQVHVQRSQGRGRSDGQVGVSQEHVGHRIAGVGRPAGEPGRQDQVAGGAMIVLAGAGIRRRLDRGVQQPL